MKFSSFLLVVMLLRAVTLIASAEEDGERNLVKRARTKQRHTNQLKDHWFADGDGDILLPNADEGNGDDSHLQTSPIGAQAGTSHDLLRERTAFSGSPESFHLLSDSSAEEQPSTEDSSRSSQDWEPEDPFLGHSSSTESEGWNPQGTSSASYSSEEWDPRRARQSASSTARTRTSLSKALTTPKAFQYKADSSSNAAAVSSRRHGASDSSALVRTSDAKEQIDRIGRLTSSQEQSPPHERRRTKRVLRIPRTENPKARKESERALEVYKDSVAAGTPEEEAQATFANKIFSICKELRKEIPQNSYQPCFQLLRVEREILSEEHRKAFKKKAGTVRSILCRKNKEEEHYEKRLKKKNKGMVPTPKQAKYGNESFEAERWSARLNAELSRINQDRKGNERKHGRRPVPWTQKRNCELEEFLARHPGRFFALRSGYRSLREMQPRQDTMATHGSGQPVERTHEEVDEHGHNLLDREEQTAKKKKKKYSSLSSLRQDDVGISATSSLHRSSRPGHYSGGIPDRRLEHVNPNDLSNDRETAMGPNQEKARSLTPNLLDLVRKPAFPRRPRSGQKRPRTEIGYGGEASPEESIGPTAESSDVRSAFRSSHAEEPRQTKKVRRPTREERRQTEKFYAELDDVVTSVVNKFKETPQRKVPQQKQKRLLATAIFDALKDFRQKILESDAAQAHRKFFVLRKLDEGLIDKELYSQLVDHLKKRELRKTPHFVKYSREYYRRRFGPNKKSLAKGETGTDEQRRQRDIETAIRSLRARLRKWSSYGATGKTRPLKEWTQADTNSVFRLARECGGNNSFLEVFEEAKPYLPPETWEEKTSGASLLGGGGKEARIGNKTGKGKVAVTLSRHQTMRTN